MSASGEDTIALVFSAFTAATLFWAASAWALLVIRYKRV